MSTFDPSQALRIDLARGQLTLLGSGDRMLVPLESLIDLLASSDHDSITAFGASIGTGIGRRIAERLGSSIDQASVELFTEHLGGELALCGLGNLSVERWGYALVLAIEGLKDSAALELLVSALIEAALQRALSRDVSVVSFGRVDATLKLSLLGHHAKDSVERAMTSGKSYGEVLTMLHESTQSANSKRGES
jgi:hypothetical protein